MPSIIDFTGFYTLIENWCRNTQSVRNKVIHKHYAFFVTSRSRTFRFGRNKELALTNKQKQFCKNLLFLRDRWEKCFLRYREPATLGYHYLFSIWQYKRRFITAVFLHTYSGTYRVDTLLTWP